MATDQFSTDFHGNQGPTKHNIHQRYQNPFNKTSILNNKFISKYTKYNIIQYINIAQKDPNQENKTLIKERKTMSVKVLK